MYIYTIIPLSSPYIITFSRLRKEMINVYKNFLISTLTLFEEWNFPVQINVGSATGIEQKRSFF